MRPPGAASGGCGQTRCGHVDVDGRVVDRARMALSLGLFRRAQFLATVVFFRPCCCYWGYIMMLCWRLRSHRLLISVAWTSGAEQVANLPKES